MQIGGGLPDIRLREAVEPFDAAGLRVTPLPLMHGKLPILGYRVGDLAYMTDVSSVPESTLPLLQNLGTMIISCVRRRPHPTHLNVAGVRRLHKRLQPKRTYLTHLAHYFTHKELSALFPPSSPRRTTDSSSRSGFDRRLNFSQVYAYCPA